MTEEPQETPPGPEASTATAQSAPLHGLAPEALDELGASLAQGVREQDLRTAEALVPPIRKLVEAVLARGTSQEVIELAAKMEIHPAAAPCDDNPGNRAPSVVEAMDRFRDARRTIQKEASRCWHQRVEGLAGNSNMSVPQKILIARLYCDLSQFQDWQILLILIQENKGNNTELILHAVDALSGRGDALPVIINVIEQMLGDDDSASCDHLVIVCQAKADLCHTPEELSALMGNCQTEKMSPRGRNLLHHVMHHITTDERLQLLYKLTPQGKKAGDA